MKESKTRSPDDDQLFGFVEAAILAGAVMQPEIQHWAQDQIEKRDEPPVWMFDVMLHEGHPAAFATIVGGGHAGSSRLWSGLATREFHALRGIAAKRGMPIDEETISRRGALRNLKANPHIERRFREVFPFIEW